MFAATSQGQGEQIIVGSLTAAAIVSFGSQMSEGKGPAFRSVVGFLAAGVGLGTVNMFSPQLASSFAVLILGSAVFVYGGPLFDSIAHLTTPPPAPGGTKGSKAAPLGTATTKAPTTKTIQA